MPKKVDANQGKIVQALRQAGASVCLLHTVGHGVPDLLVGYRARNYLLEVKTQTGRLTPDEEHFFDEWRGHAWVVRDVDEALAAIGAI